MKKTLFCIFVFLVEFTCFSEGITNFCGLQLGTYSFDTHQFFIKKVFEQVVASTDDLKKNRTRLVKKNFVLPVTMLTMIN